MQQPYSQYKALWAITKASLIATLKNPSSLFFSLLFPLIFVFIFGSFKGEGLLKFRLGLAAHCDTTNVVYQSLQAAPFISIEKYTDTAEQRKDLEKGKLAAIVQITALPKLQGQKPQYTLHLRYTTATSNDVGKLQLFLESIVNKLQQSVEPPVAKMVTITTQMYFVRAYRQIDFVLPGQIGFSILFATLFGIAYTFFNLREQLILKRFYATPVKKLNILIGIGFSRIFFQLVNVVVLIAVGHLFLHFTLAHGWVTFVEMTLLSCMMLIFLMGVGLLFSSLPKTDSTIPLYINVFSLPQMLLSGTFFPTTVFPKWLQQCTQLLPLTHFNSAIRKISFEGVGLWECWPQLSVLALWTVVVYAVVYKFFKWE